ncbi:HDOD domain-containing protein [Methylocaldum szegediense]|uniref:HD-like signal output (HDOD) protein n=1 Tax=Methylocaldum szegediense TaxID=73780 RepID=A0ABM9HXM2_9GAMM|nr:HDOD domain-containing protein [Methylocaldum szegediense]CAI8752382.1 HD-like signal output (HDOD) protein [Methylocaldum szegediense]
MDLRNEQVFLDYIKAAIENDKLQLPTIPEVALRVRQTINKDNASDTEIAETISSDPALSARLLQIANSPLYRTRQKIETLRAAITRLGHRTVRNVVMNLAMKQVFKPSSLLLESRFHEIWQHSLSVAAVCRALAVRTRPLDPDQAMLAGLIHQIGKLPILTLAEKFPELLEDDAILENHLENLHTQIGKIIMETWALPDSMSRAAWEYRDFQRDGSTPDYVDLVQVAYLGSVMGTKAAPSVDLSRVPAFTKLGLTPEIEILEIEGVAAEVEEAQQLFA